MTGQNKQASGGRVKNIAIFILKLTVSALLFWRVFSSLSLAEVTAAMDSPRWGWLLAAFLVYGLSALGGALQWSWILKVSGIESSQREIRRLYFIGLFFNNFLPANIGGDAYKIIDLGRQEKRPLAVFCGTLLDRLMGLTALTFLAVLVLAVASTLDIPLPVSALWMIPAVVFLVCVLTLLLSRRLGRILPAVFLKFGFENMAERMVKLTDEFACFRRRVRWLNGIFIFSMGVQFLRMVTHLLVAWGLGFHLGWEQAVQLLVLIPMLAVSLTLPVTINGIGLRESISATLLVLAGLTAPQAVAMEVAAYLVMVLFSLQGGVLLWTAKFSRKPAS